VLEDYACFSSEKSKWPGVEKFRYFQGLPVVTDNDPPIHTRLRRLMTPAFSPRRLAAIEADLTVCVHALLDDFAQAGQFDAQIDYGHRLSERVLFGLLLGLPEEDWGVFVKVLRAMSLYNDVKAGDPPPAAYLEAWDAARSYCEAMIESQRQNPTDDLMGSIIAEHVSEGKVSTDELLATLFVMYLGGAGGIANTVAWTLLRLCRHRDQLELLQQNPGLLVSAVDEGIRIDPNAYHVLRFATHDFEFEGLRLAKGMPVLVMSGAPNFDPGRHEDPLRFDITRTARRDSLAFGYGVHHCIGMALARMNARIAIGAVVARFPRLRLADEALQPVIIGNSKERGIASVPLLID
jgi:cytochrome P450